MNNILAALFLLIHVSIFSQIITNQDKLGIGQNFTPINGFLMNDGSKLLYSSCDSIIGGDKIQYGNGNYDGWITKLENNHQIPWQINLGGSSYESILTAKELTNGDLLLGGISKSQASGNKTSPNFGNEDAWLVKMDASGNILWDKSYGGISNDRLVDIATDNNSYYLLCNSQSSATGNKTTANFGQSDIWLVKTDLNGNIIWQKSYGGSGFESATSILLLNNSIFISSSSQSGQSGNKLSTNYGLRDSWVLKLDGNGNIINQDSFGGNFDEVDSKLYEFNGKLFLTDVSYSDQNTGNKTSPNFGGNDGRVLFLNNNLIKNQEKSFGGDNLDYISYITFNSANQMIIASTSLSSISGNKTVVPNGSMTNGNYAADIWLIIYDTIQNLPIYQQSIGGNDSDILLNADSFNNTQSISFICQSNSGISGDKTIPLTANQTPGNYLEFWTFDYTYTLDLEEENTNNTLSIYPNPFTSKINLTKTFANQEIAFYTTQGRLVLKTKSNGHGVVETSQLAEGFYILKLIDEFGKLYTTKVIKQ